MHGLRGASDWVTPEPWITDAPEGAGDNLQLTPDGANIGGKKLFSGEFGQAGR